VTPEAISLPDAFVKFPRTPHLFWLGSGPPRGDKLMASAEAEEWLRRPASVEEKVDGANLGLSLDSEGHLRAQSRGHFLEPGAEGQWKPLWRWLAQRGSQFASALGRDLVAFGEWCYAEHSTSYDALPDWFLLFDVYGRKEGRFWSRARRDELARQAGVSTVPLLRTGPIATPELRKHLGKSRLGSALAEGLYLRWDDDRHLLARAKVVRPGWLLASNEHWSSRPLKTNRLSAATTIHA
jgi:ATP-dependent RNA circularization protein (DNA/RNA ligase family)